MTLDIIMFFKILDFQFIYRFEWDFKSHIFNAFQNVWMPLKYESLLVKIYTAKPS